MSDGEPLVVAGGEAGGLEGAVRPRAEDQPIGAPQRVAARDGPCRPAMTGMMRASAPATGLPASSTTRPARVAASVRGTSHAQRLRGREQDAIADVGRVARLVRTQAVRPLREEPADPIAAVRAAARRRACAYRPPR